MRLLCNKIINSTKTRQSNSDDTSYKLPPKLKRTFYGNTLPSKDNFINESVQRMESELDEVLRSHPDSYHCKNLSKDEQEGLKWLQKKTSEEAIAVVEADKGGAILITTPALLNKLTLEKLTDNNLYTKIQTDPTKNLHKELQDLWIEGKSQGLITPKEAKDVIGICDNYKTDRSGPTSRISTLPHYRPGKAYFYPSMKIHKCKTEDLKPGIEPPVRLITAMQDGITKRSDVFLADKFLRPLEKDFCKDLLLDTNDTLKWLDDTDKQLDPNLKSRLKSFSFDFKSLYDSLSPTLVLEALKCAMDEQRSTWSNELKEWILDLVQLSLDSAVGQFGDTFYKQINGVPTGGSICVQLANIAVFYIMRKCVYCNEDLMSKVISLKRYIDDGAGFFNGTPRQFSDWIAKVNSLLRRYSLTIDEYSIKSNHELEPFLDLKFAFDESGDLQTDLYIKPTDSRAYLQYGSEHPNHTYSGIVYSQFLRLRRIINNNERLKAAIDVMKQQFLIYNYPKKMVSNIAEKVSKMERNLSIHKDKSKNMATDSSSTPIRAISTFGCDSALLKIATKYDSIIASHLSSKCPSPSTPHSESLPTPTHSSHSASQPVTHSTSNPNLPAAHPHLASQPPQPTQASDLTPDPQTPTLPASLSTPQLPSPLSTPQPPPLPTSENAPKQKIFNFVKRTGPSCRSKLVKLKNLALNKCKNPTKPCNHRNCQCCKMISPQNSFKINGKVIKPINGNCNTYNIIYCAMCIHCNAVYVGRSIRELHTRISEHRQGFYKILSSLNINLANETYRDDDLYSLGYHLIDKHNFNSKTDFNNSYKVFILDICSPKVIEIREHHFIHELKSLKPFGINSTNPFSIPLLNL